MKFRPLHDRVVVKRIEAEEKSAGGIIRTPPRKSHRKERSSPWAPVAATKPASLSPSTCRSAAGRWGSTS